MRYNGLAVVDASDVGEAWFDVSHPLDKDKQYLCPSGGWPTAAAGSVQCNKQRPEVIDFGIDGRFYRI
jgi:hypothetical protein